MSTERTLAMQKNFKKDLDTKYNDIFRNLYVQWKLQSKKKYEELQSNGLANSGVGSKTMYTLMEELINITICELQQLFINLPTTYNRKISLKEINEYKEKTLNNIEGHINSMEKELMHDYENKLLFIVETNQIFVNNLKSNSKNKIEKIFDEIVNLRKGKKIEGLVIFNIIFTILSFLIGIASLIVGIIGIVKK
mgnify:FL=1|jgi:hypothetical protein